MLKGTNKNFCFKQAATQRNENNLSAVIKLKTVYRLQTKTTSLQFSTESNVKKDRWNFKKILCNKEKSQTRMQALLNKFGAKITISMENVSLLN